jgi:hypothetical protein
VRLKFSTIATIQDCPFIDALTDSISIAAIS